jgi:hypothetical protein
MADAEIEIARRAGYNGMARELRILVDGRKAGVVRNGKTLSLSTPAGRHEIVGQMDWIKSKPITVEAAPGRKVTVEAKLCNAFLALFALFGMVPYISLRELR